MRPLVYPVAVAAGLLLAPAARADDWYAKAVKSVTARFEPAEAKPGQLVTLKLTVVLNDGYHTYPTAQPDKNAAGMVNKLAFPPADGVVFVGDTKDPPKPDVKAEPDLGIKELRTHHGTVVYERPAVVSPKAEAGERTVKLKAFKLTVCDAANCYPPKTLAPAATLKVLPGPAAEVPKEHREAVEKALAGR